MTQSCSESGWITSILYLLLPQWSLRLCLSSMLTWTLLSLLTALTSVCDVVVQAELHQSPLGPPAPPQAALMLIVANAQTKITRTKSIHSFVAIFKILAYFKSFSIVPWSTVMLFALIWFLLVWSSCGIQVLIYLMTAAAVQLASLKFFVGVFWLLFISLLSYYLGGQKSTFLVIYSYTYLEVGQCAEQAPICLLMYSHWQL